MPDTRPARSRMSAERIAELFDAVRQLLLEAGYERLTYDAVAARARTSKATLYRQWPTKADLVLAALTEHPPAWPDVSRAPSLDAAFAELTAWGRRTSAHDLSLGFRLLYAAADDPGFAAALRKQIITPAVRSVAVVFEAAADRGEVQRDRALFQRLAYLIIADFAFFPLIKGQSGASARSHQELFRTVVRPALTFTDPSR